MSKRSSSDFSKSLSIHSIDERIEASQLSVAILQRKTSVQIGEGLTKGVVHSSHFWQLGSIASVATEITGLEDSSRI